MTTIVKMGQTIPLKIKRLGINGEGIGYYKRLIIFVPNTLPKEEVQVKITKLTPKFAEATLVKILKESKERVEPPCSVYEACGGCQLQHLSYPAQLDFKRDLLKQSLEKFKPENYTSYELRPTLGMKDPWHYRNKAQFQLRQNPQTKRVEAGLYRADSHDLVSIDNCLVQEKQTTNVMNTIVQLLNKYELPIYDERKNSGIFRTIMVRIGIQTQEIQVVFITSTPKFPQKNALIREMNQRLPKVVSIMQNVQSKKTSLIMGEDTFHLWGKEAIEEQINQVVFDLSARAFFQLNPQQTSVLYEEGIKALDLKKEETVVDAYCGVGTIGLSIAGLAKEVRGMDTIEQAIFNAQENAARLGFSNTHYEVGTAEELLPKWFKEGFKPDALIVDPPRTGLDSKLLTALKKQPPKKMVYISCNVSTLARDLKELTTVFTVDYLQSVDMFPQTARCEVVVKLSKK
ncbi:23S rRNA (uracil-5-)-methyltransferase RumA [Enterococcus phoeniculicola]|jgi:23S rRNA (uracil1939-C5)-methyltransferase|uniref:23S rRNA (Uracil-5-)-methyltransferase RumA n=2 Tax=Enterococcus phoeniculicola TaxID=154621 RepID=R3U135_9ENTE|nr:23S rRNA (uracil-5-)-methyltransferase RumA [Enterococcus phoeniculicola ATCC BAA-412]EOT72849.1 23S rRNA (uracil-5-)-methyltransferase RumA [Enterococcus phoeniculicola ATCC BAA-412]OJG71340.1 23S rRNA (uracil-5-)-methyltransferase RumA [Enterococcus phoeniculicola]